MTTENKESKTGIEVNIISLLLELLRHFWLIAIFAVVFGLLAFGFTKIMIHPTYRCTFTAYVNNQHAQSSKDSLTVSDVSASKELVRTYSKILTSNTILGASIESAGLSYTPGQLQGMVSTEIQDETEIISVHVVASSPEEAYNIASAVATVAPVHMADIVEGSSMKIVDNPQLPTGIYKPSYIKYTMIGAFIGVLLILIFLIIRYFTNDTLKSDEELESKFAIPVIGVIPDINDVNRDRSGYYYAYASDKKPEEEKSSDRGE